jgi:hypothetical protein
MICNHALYVIQTGRHGESTERSEFVIKYISSVFLNLRYGLVKGFRVYFTEQPAYSTLRISLPSKFSGQCFDVATEGGSYLGESGLYKVDEYF